MEKVDAMDMLVLTFGDIIVLPPYVGGENRGQLGRLSYTEKARG